MRHRSITPVILAALLLPAGCATGPRQQTSTDPRQRTLLPERAVRRDIPLGPMIRRAYAAGTRDSTGAPGRRYWQHKVDYRIEASIDPSTNQLRGSETITLHNSSPDTLTQVVLRLYQNFFSPRVQRAASVTDITDGMIVERLSVNGARRTLTDTAHYRLDGTIASVRPP